MWFIDGIAAWLLLVEVAPQFVHQVPGEVWHAWIPVVVQHGRLDDEAMGLWNRWANTIPDQGLAAVTETVERWLAGATALDVRILLGILRAVPRFQTPDVVRVLRHYTEARTEHGSASDVLEALLEFDRDYAVKSAEMAIRGGPATRGALRVALLSGEARMLEMAIEILRDDSELALEVIGPIADHLAAWRTQNDPARGWPSRLPPCALGCLFVLLLELWPPVPNERPPGLHVVGDREMVIDLRDRIPDLLAKQCSHEAVAELERLVPKATAAGFDLRYAIASARQNHRIQTWKAPTIAEVRALFGLGSDEVACTRRALSTLREMPLAEQALAMGFPSAWDLFADTMFSASIQLLERLTMLPANPEEDKLTDLLAAFLMPRTEPLGWTWDVQSRGGSSGIPGRTRPSRGGVGERDIVALHRGTPFAMVEAVVLSSVRRGDIKSHLYKLMSARGYNAAGLRIAAFVCYVRAADFGKFIDRFDAVAWGLVPAGHEIISKMRISESSTKLVAWEVYYSTRIRLLCLLVDINR